jgi:hypothetical protein
MLPPIMLIPTLPVPVTGELPAVVGAGSRDPGVRRLAADADVAGCRCARIVDWILASIPDSNPCNDDAIAVCTDWATSELSAAIPATVDALVDVVLGPVDAVVTAVDLGSVVAGTVIVGGVIDDIAMVFVCILPSRSGELNNSESLRTHTVTLQLVHEVGCLLSTVQRMRRSTQAPPHITPWLTTFNSSLKFQYTRRGCFRVAQN